MDTIKKSGREPVYKGSIINVGVPRDRTLRNSNIFFANKESME